MASRERARLRVVVGHNGSVRTAAEPIATPPGGDPAAGHAPKLPWWVGAVTGVVAMALGLVTAELLTAGLDGDSPVVEVGDRVVDLVPKPLRDWAISTFGTNDKAVLLAGVAAVLIAIAVLAGELMVRGRRGAAVGVVGVTLALGALAPLGRGGSGWGSTLAILIGGLVSVGVLWFLAGIVRRDPAASPVPESQESEPHVMEPAESQSMLPQPMTAATRRRFLGYAGAGAGLAIVGAGLSAWIRSQAAVATERLGITLPKALQPLPAVPQGTSVGIDGVAPFVTPNKDFFRIDTALLPPRVTTEDWSMRVHGLVDTEVRLDYAELLERPMIEVDATIACVSNEVGDDLIGNARWLGCRLDDLLAEAGINPAADQIVGRSVDGFTAGFPTDTLDGREAIVAVGMNGDPLPVEHGYPARLIVPGLYGYVSATKWLSEIELTTFAAFNGYWIPRGWDVEAPVVTMSRIDTPKDGDSVTAGSPVGVGGVAWAMNRGVAKVEVAIDGGEWQQAELGEQYTNTTWRQWGYTFEPTVGDHEIKARATDTDGFIQSAEEVGPGPNAATGHHTIRITAS